jgi:hypothetical protein
MAESTISTYQERPEHQALERRPRRGAHTPEREVGDAQTRGVGGRWRYTSAVQAAKALSAGRRPALDDAS